MLQEKLTRLVPVISMYLFVTAVLPNSIYSEPGMDWHQFHGPNRDRISTEKGWRTNWDEKEPKVLWSKSIGKGFASMSVVGNRVFTMGNTDDKDTVWCFDAETGDEIWRHTYSCELYPKQHEGGPGGTPTVDADSVYTVSKEGHMFCLDVKTGDVKWSKNLQEEFDTKMPTWRFALSPLLEGDKIILDVGPAIALDKKTGDLIWKTQNYKSAYASPAAFDLNGKRYIAIVPEFGLVILDAKNGKEIGKYEWKTRYGVNAATPLIQGNKVFVSSGYNKGGSLLEIGANSEIKELWHNRLMRNQMNACVLWEGSLYGFDESTLRCIDFKTGEERWKERTLGKGSLMLADGKLIILGEKGDLVIAEANATEFKPLCRKKVLSGRCWTIPVLSHGKIFCRNAAGDFVCLDVRG